MTHILLIEPDYLLSATYAQALERAGHQVAVAATAQSAIMAADRQTPDIIILELQLVEHSGIEFLYELRSYPEWQDIPVLIQTLVPPGEFTDSWPLLRDQLGVEAYLYKPRTSLHELVSSVQSASYV